MRKCGLIVLLGCFVLVAEASQPYVAAEGDSIVSGTGSTGGSNWVFQIATYLRTDMTFTNLGLAGDTILANTNATNVLAMFTNQNATACRLVATCYFGHNDIAQNDSVANITTNLLTFATNIHFAFPAAKIVAMTLHGINYGGTQSTFEPRRLSVNSWINGAGTNYFNYICDLASDSRLTNFVDTTYYDADQVHLNNIGYQLVAKWVSTNLVNNGLNACASTAPSPTLTLGSATIGNGKFQ